MKVLGSLCILLGASCCLAAVASAQDTVTGYVSTVDENTQVTQSCPDGSTNYYDSEDSVPPDSDPDCEYTQVTWLTVQGTVDGLSDQCTYDLYWAMDTGDYVAKSVSGVASGSALYSGQEGQDSFPTGFYAVCTGTLCRLTVSLSGPRNLGVDTSLLFPDCTGTYTASVSGGSGNYSYEWQGSADSSPSSGDSSKDFQPSQVGSQSVSVTVTDNSTGCTQSATISVTVHDTYENVHQTGSTISYGPISQTIAIFRNPSPTTQTGQYTEKWSSSITVKTSIQGSLSAEEAGVKIGLTDTVETSSTVTAETSSGATVSIPPGGVIYLKARPFINEVTGAYTQWDCTTSTANSFTLDFDPAVEWIYSPTE